MGPSPAWYRIAADPSVLRRAALTSLGVGTILTIANHFDDLTTGRMAEYQLLPIAITYVVPFLVSIASSVIALRVERRRQAVATGLLQREIEKIERFPGQNPNPVLRLAEDGRLLYANAASAPITAALGVTVGDRLQEATMAALRAAAEASPGGTVEVEHGERTFAILPVHVRDLRVYNLYGTDVTAAKVVERFPDRNPSPVLRLSGTGELQYANAASEPITDALALAVGDHVPEAVWQALLENLADASAGAPEVGSGGRA